MSAFILAIDVRNMASPRRTSKPLTPSSGACIETIALAPEPGCSEISLTCNNSSPEPWGCVTAPLFKPLARQARCRSALPKADFLLLN